MIRGGCLCGTVQFAIEPPYRWFAYCHCSMCRIHHGALFSAGVGVERARFEWQRGRGAVVAYRSTDAFERAFCRHCGSKVPSESHIRDVLLVPAGTLDDLDATPRAHIFVASKSGAHEIRDALLRFDAYPPGVGLPAVAAPHEPAEEAALAGRCLCGAIGYAFDAPPERAAHCHCSLCRRSRGGPFATTSYVPAERFRFTRGEDAAAAFRMAPPRAYGTDFCSLCGSLLPTVVPEAGFALVPTGALALPERPLRAVHLYVGSKADWDVINDDEPQFDEMPPQERFDELF